MPGGLTVPSDENRVAPRGATTTEEVERMQRKRLFAVVSVTAAVGAGGVALADHVPVVDPATVPTGFLSAHVDVGDMRVSAFARAVKRNDADVFVQHARLAANEATPWHTHPGPAIVTIVRGALTYEDAKGRRCRRKTYPAGTGFMDRGFGHVHRAVAGAEGADFYVTYILPSGSETHLTPSPAPRACA
jgi:hypothetical protein